MSGWELWYFSDTCQECHGFCCNQLMTRATHVNVACNCCFSMNCAGGTCFDTHTHAYDHHGLAWQLLIQVPARDQTGGVGSEIPHKERWEYDRCAFTFGITSVCAEKGLMQRCQQHVNLKQRGEGQRHCQGHEHVEWWKTGNASRIFGVKGNGCPCFAGVVERLLLEFDSCSNVEPE